MTEAEWLACEDPEPVLQSLLDARGGTNRYPGCRVTDRKLRLLAVGVCRLYWDELGGERNRRRVEVAERYADGLADEDELIDAHGGVYSKTVFVGYTMGGPHAAAVVACLLNADLGARHVLDICSSPGYGSLVKFWTVKAKLAQKRRAHLGVLRDVFGNPFRPVAFSPEWRTDTAVTLARQMYEAREFSAMPILADALQDAGCDNHEVLNHCRDAAQPHVRGCWVVDLVLGKE